MYNRPTSGMWRTSPLRSSVCDWPFDWVTEITALDPDTQVHQCIGTIRQSGARPIGEAAANARAIGEAGAMARIVETIGHILNMSDPDADEFIDSAADCLEVLLQQAPEIARILSALAGPRGAATAPALENHGQQRR
jgi:hypothetical protein